MLGSSSIQEHQPISKKLAYAEAGLTHGVIRFAGEHERQLEAIAGVRARLGW